MTETQNNIFLDPPAVPSLASDEALARLRQQLSPKEYYYCGLHLLTTLDADKYKNFSVGSVKRYLLVQECTVCCDDALFVVIEG